MRKWSETQQRVCSVCPLERLVHQYNRRLTKFVQQGRSKARRRGVPGEYVEGLSDARTKLPGFFSLRISYSAAVGLRCLINRAR